MSETIIAAMLSGIVTLAVSLITNLTSNAKNRALIEYQLVELQKKVEKHNNVIERTYILEQQNAVHVEQIKVINHRIDDLESKQ